VLVLSNFLQPVSQCLEFKNINELFEVFPHTGLRLPIWGNLLLICIVKGKLSTIIKKILANIQYTILLLPSCPLKSPA